MEYTVKQSNIEEIIESEKEMVLNGKSIYGDYYVNAVESNYLLNNFIKSVEDVEKFIFIAFLSQIKKHHTLALFSALRLHFVQMGMNLRQVLEAGAWAVYAMGNKEEEKFRELTSEKTFIFPDKLQKTRNSWIESKYADNSSFFLNFKKIINKHIAHPNLMTAHQNFSMNDIKNKGFHTPFFDHFDEVRVKTNLWMIANISLSLLNLFCIANKEYKIFKTKDDFSIKMKEIISQNDLLKDDMMKNTRLKKFFS